MVKEYHIWPFCVNSGLLLLVGGAMLALRRKQKQVIRFH